MQNISGKIIGNIIGPGRIKKDRYGRNQLTRLPDETEEEFMRRILLIRERLKELKKIENS